MLANYRISEKEIVLAKNIGYNSSSRASELYNTHFMHFQIFKADQLKSITPELLKVDEIDFFESEASFVNFMLESNNF